MSASQRVPCLHSPPASCRLRLVGGASTTAGIFTAGWLVEYLILKVQGLIQWPAPNRSARIVETLADDGCPHASSPQRILRAPLSVHQSSASRLSGQRADVSASEPANRADCVQPVMPTHPLPSTFGLWAPCRTLPRACPSRRSTRGFRPISTPICLPTPHTKNSSLRAIHLLQPLPRACGHALATSLASLGAVGGTTHHHGGY